MWTNRLDIPRGATVHLVDRSAEGRAALAAQLRQHGAVVREHPDVDDLLADHGLHEAGCVLLEAGPDGMPALAIQRTLHAQGVDAPVIVLARTPSLEACVACMRAGAADFLDRMGPPQSLWAAVAAALQVSGQRGVSRALRVEVQGRLARLTPRERDVVALVVAGGRNANIAARLGIATQTVKSHRSRAMLKLECTTPADLVRLWWTARGVDGTPTAEPLPLWLDGHRGRARPLRRLIAPEMAG